MRHILWIAITRPAMGGCLFLGKLQRIGFTEEPLAAALGAGLDIRRPMGTMVVDIGGGTADIAVVTMGSISISKSVKIAGNILDEDIIRYLRRERNIVIGEKTAESIKKRIGCAYLRDTELAIGIKGKHYITGMPITDEVNTTEVYLAMRTPSAIASRCSRIAR